MPAQAQEGTLAGRTASPAPGTQWWEVNSEAWDSFASFDGERIFGRSDQYDFDIAVAFESEYSLWGRQVSQQAIVPEFVSRSPLFGGEGYAVLNAVVPLDSSPFATQLHLLGGWKYHLTPILDVDIGGDFAFYDDDVTGPGLPADNGGTFFSPFYVGLLGRVFLTPSLYFSFEPDLQQVSIIAGLDQSFDLKPVTGVAGLSFTLHATAGWLDATAWRGNDGPRDLRISYTYWDIRGDLKYALTKNLSTSIGIRYAGNDDDDGERLGGVDLGNNEMLWGGVGLRYSF